MSGDESFVFFGLVKKSEIYGKDEADDSGRSLYVTKYRFSFSKRLALHVFTRGDADDDPHDHPWDFWTFPLVAYNETVGHKQIHQQKVEQGKWHFRKATHVHRVTGSVFEAALNKWEIFSEHLLIGENFVDYWRAPWLTSLAWYFFGEGKIVTIVWMSKPYREWGFYVKAENGFVWVPWRQYVDGTENWIKK